MTFTSKTKKIISISLSLWTLAVIVIFYPILRNIHEKQLDSIYVDANHTIKFSEDSVSPFILCMIKDYKNNKSNWSFNKQNFIDGMCEDTFIKYNKKSMIPMGYTLGVTFEECFTNKTLKFGLYKDMTSGYDNIRDTIKNYKVAILDSFMENKYVKLNVYDKFYITKVFKEEYDKRKVVIDSIANAQIKKDTERENFVNDSINKSEQKRLHDKYYPNCK